MKITRLGPARSLLSATSLGGSGGTLDPVVGSGLVPTASGSNSWAWASNVARITADGSNVLGPFVNFAAGSNIIFALSSNTINIASAAGGSTSYGSNSNAVSEANAGGASTLASRADHVHLGVRSLAHSSNSFSGPVILTASGTLGITSPTPGTYNLSAGTGGPGGSGAPTTAEYLVTTADATLSAERVVDLGAYQLLTRRAAANTEDDHFNTSPLAAKWLAFTNADGTTDLTDMPGWVKFTQAASGFKIQAVPAGDWTIEGECLAPTQTTTSFDGAILILSDGTNATAGTQCQYVFGQSNSLTIYRLNASKFVNNAFSATYTDYTFIHPTNHMFIRIVKSGTNYYWEWSNTGKTWQRWGSTAALGFVPTHFGLGGNVGSYWNYFLRY